MRIISRSASGSPSQEGDQTWSPEPVPEHISTDAAVKENKKTTWVREQSSQHRQSSASIDECSCCQTDIENQHSDLFNPRLWPRKQVVVKRKSIHRMGPPLLINLILWLWSIPMAVSWWLHVPDGTDRNGNENPQCVTHVTAEGQCVKYCGRKEKTTLAGAYG